MCKVIGMQCNVTGVSSNYSYKVQASVTGCFLHWAVQVQNALLMPCD